MSSLTSKSRLYGYTCAIGAYFIWGIIPFYWKLLTDIPVLDTVALRITGTLVFCVLAIKAGIVRRQSGGIRWQITILSAIALFINWGTYIWAVEHKQLLQASLGYFICPLISVFLGWSVLGEKLSSLKKVAVGVAACAVVILIAHLGLNSWVSFSVAFSFAFYGLLKKHVRTSSLEALGAEMVIGIVPALAYLALVGSRPGGFVDAFATHHHLAWLALLLGPFTIIPLVMFAEGARNLPLSSVGLISFLTPSVKFVVAVAFFGEEFSVAFRWAFPLIWVALVLYILDEYGYSHKLCRVRKVCSES